ncbi:Hypothetical Protein XCAW_01040 [Xanthomonas citri subsp. citri Aw12879]|nr:Hypothetical Protein XCAW_01040 [Xanthomonas citri subsp. citri Aw12879]AJZ43250.1 hypothetical protein J165_01097 [Xanthomonas citri pv. citri]AJZ47866.1 hypothetical protein J166_01098 [Xanthomonas citri pv. citri]AJZ52485.1 hypothetical protein J167_01097 [Xanthomonas citri pv. citri]AJZ65280.1 hypothetical protein J168_01097 [Xanthomonas citri pv. citri]
MPESSKEKLLPSLLKTGIQICSHGFKILKMSTDIECLKISHEHSPKPL